MPQINITVAKKLSDETKNALQAELADNIGMIPGKKKEVLAVCVIDGCSFFKNAEPVDGAFIEVRIFKNTTEDARKKFTAFLFDMADRVLGVPADLLTINFIELPNWGSFGEYKTTLEQK